MSNKHFVITMDNSVDWDKKKQNYTDREFGKKFIPIIRIVYKLTLN